MDALRERFLNPGAAFSPLPFWFWNDHVTEQGIAAQLNDFLEKGVHGFVLHPRMGLSKDIGYLTDAYMHLVALAVEEAEKRGMAVVLYDEAMYPSGSAHGGVVKANPALASRGITLYEKANAPMLAPAMRVVAQTQGHVVMEDFTYGTIRGVHPGEDDGEQAAPRSADLFNPDATRLFIQLTHEAYYARLSRHFGQTVIAMFTDEPCPTGRNVKQGVLAWCGAFDNSFSPNEMVRLLQGGDEGLLSRYESLVSDRLGETYYGPLKHWCESHGIALTGHPHEPDNMALLKHFSIPGQDVVWRWVAPEGDKGLVGRESTQAKCASSAACHGGIARNSNECFGCCGPDGQQWAFTVDDMKWYLDWLFVRGTNLIYPHAFFYSVESPLQWNERPPDVGPNNYFWPHYKQIALYISRMCAMLTGGVIKARVAVLASGERLPWRLPRYLFENQIDFNYLQTELLSSADMDGNTIRIARQTYDALAVEDESLLPPDGRDQIPLKVVTMDCLNDLLAFKTLRIEPPCPHIRAAWHKHGSVDLFLLTNEGEADYTGQVNLPVLGFAEKWDAWQGSVTPLGQAANGLPLHLPRRGSCLIAVNPADSREYTPPPEAALEKCDLPLQWTKATDQGATLCGSAVYEAAFTLSHVPQRLVLDLGEVREMAEVSVNGCQAMPLLLKPFRLDIAPWVQKGANRLTVRATSSRVSFFESIPWPGGLLGPVSFLTLRPSDV